MKIKKLLTNIWDKIKPKSTKKLKQQYLDVFDKNYIISKTDVNGVITYANDEFLRMHGLKESQVLGKTHSVISTGLANAGTYADLWNTITSGKIWHGTLCFRDPKRKMRFAHVKIFPIFNNRGKITEYLAIRNDITELVVMEKEVEETQKELIMSLGSVIENKNGELHGHVDRVANYSYILAKGMGLSEKEANIIRIASPMHDAGKIGVPEELLNAPRRLNKDEFEIIKTHSQIGYDIFKNSNLAILKTAAKIAYHHHEKWDGAGYPQGLSGTDISIEGRVTAVADVYDALASKRVYKRAWSIAKIDEYLMSESGKSFDPEVIRQYFINKKHFGVDDF